MGRQFTPLKIPSYGVTVQHSGKAKDNFSLSFLALSTEGKVPK